MAHRKTRLVHRAPALPKSQLLKIVCFKWQYDGRGYMLPSQHNVQYSANHVNTLFRMLRRHSRDDFEAVCFTDDPKGIDENIRVAPIWDRCMFLGGCFNRLYAFSSDMERYIGKRFLLIDIDCVVLGDVTPLLRRSEDFIINTYQNGDAAGTLNQIYNGSLMMMDAGARHRVWEEFDFKHHPAMLAERTDRVGTDQAWIRHCLGPDEARFHPEEGVLEARLIGMALPRDAKIVFFSGRRDPSTSLRYNWVRENYR